MIERHFASLIRERWELARCLYVGGARQVGKTTLLRALFPELPYVNLETPETRRFAIDDPKGFLREHPEGAILDEVQRVPELFSWLQESIDSGVRWILSGSQNYLLLESISQSLAGRVSILELPGLTPSELRRQSAPDPWRLLRGESPIASAGESRWEILLRGGYPEPVLKPRLRHAWNEDYLRTYVERDVRQLVNIRDLSLFQRFVSLCAGRTGQVLNSSSLGSDAGVSERTARSWVSLLEAAGILFLLPAHHRNFNKQVMKSPKLYFCDTGLACHLLGLRDSKTLSVNPFAGSLFETWVVGELRKLWMVRGERAPLFWWRDSAGLEIDLLVDLPEGLWPIEIKSGETVDPSLWKNLARFHKLQGDAAPLGTLLHGGDLARHQSGVHVVPWSVF